MNAVGGFSACRISSKLSRSSEALCESFAVCTFAGRARGTGGRRLSVFSALLGKIRQNIPLCYQDRLWINIGSRCHCRTANQLNGCFANTEKKSWIVHAAT